ncbi:uncharacterized protein LOC100123026 isoform X4 [Nasonia vitripennis]|uniref:Karmoisin n=1 Tax=Nasonia vitripennis TaxID=7425 RepID=A0A7M7HA79_NASVI|nr:uncharacterized protein LOC100123026 isoform X4 [Nasonia vitripennis]
MMTTDKEPDNGINIKFGADRTSSKKGEYRLVAQQSNAEKGINGSAKKAAGPKKRAQPIDPDCEMVPPDGGWGWFVLVAAVMVNVLIPGGIKSFSVFYKAFQDQFESSLSAASWIPALCYFLYSSLGPLSSILSVKYSYRTVSLIGGTFAAAGMMLTYFATSIGYLYWSYGIFVGIGAGLAFPPTVYIVTSYFVRLRGLANGFCISGSSLGSIIMPPIITKLLQENEVRTVMLLMGAVTLNVWACALLYDPVEKHLIPAKRKAQRDEEEATVLEPLAEADVGIAITGPPPSDEEPAASAASAAPGVPKSASSVALENYHKPGQARARKISMPVSGREMAGQMRSTPALHAVPESQRLSRRPRPPPLSPSTSSFNYISTPFHGSTLTALHPEYASTLTLNAISSTFARKSPEKTAKQQQQQQQQDQDVQAERSKFFDCSLLADPMYLIILISNSTNAISYTNFVILLANYCKQLDFSEYQASLLLSTISLFDLVASEGQLCRTPDSCRSIGTSLAAFSYRASRWPSRPSPRTTRRSSSTAASSAWPRASTWASPRSSWPTCSASRSSPPPTASRSSSTASFSWSVHRSAALSSITLEL